MAWKVKSPDKRKKVASMIDLSMLDQIETQSLFKMQCKRVNKLQKSEIDIHKNTIYNRYLRNFTCFRAYLLYHKIYLTIL